VNVVTFKIVSPSKRNPKGVLENFQPRHHDGFPEEERSDEDVGEEHGGKDFKSIHDISFANLNTY
jgi:hypothetical protein